MWGRITLVCPVCTVHYEELRRQLLTSVTARGKKLFCHTTRFKAAHSLVLLGVIKDVCAFSCELQKHV